MSIRPMKANPVDVVPEGPAWAIQPKWDGHRILAGRWRKEATASGPQVLRDAVSEGVWLQTPEGGRRTSVPYIQKALMALLPPDTIVDGEIVDRAGGAQWNRVQSILTRHETHRITAASPPLTFMVFDLLHLDGVDVRDRPLRERLQLLAKLFELGEARGAKLSDEHGTYVDLTTTVDADADLAEAWVQQGFEGAVVKRWDSRYVAGAGGGWLKWKPSAEIEAVCTGTYEATPGSKYDGRAVGGITFHVKHADGREYDGRCAGMNDRLREALYNHPEDYVGRVVELTYKLITNTGALRHPNLLRFRDPLDKKEPRVTKTIRVASEKAPSGKRHTRSYAAMGSEKLLACYESLRAEEGDAYERCLESGSGAPAADYETVLALAIERGLL